MFRTNLGQTFAETRHIYVNLLQQNANYTAEISVEIIVLLCLVCLAPHGFTDKPTRDAQVVVNFVNIIFSIAR